MFECTHQRTEMYSEALRDLRLGSYMGSTFYFDFTFEEPYGRPMEDRLQLGNT